MSKTTQPIPENTIAQQRELSLFTMQTLYTVYQKLKLRIDSNDDCVAVYYVSPEQISAEKIPLKKKDIQRQEVRLLDIYHEKHSTQETYQIRIQNGDRRLISFDDTFFSNDDKHNYLAAFFYILQHQNEGKKSAKTPQSIESRQALSDLEKKQFSSDITKYTAWNEEYMKSLLYLSYILNDERSERK